MYITIFECISVSKSYRPQLDNWWNNLPHNKVVLTEKHVIFWLYHDTSYLSNIIYVILLANMLYK